MKNSVRNLSLAIFIGSVLFMALARPLGFQWDFFVFYDAGRSWSLNLNPYDSLLLAAHGGRHAELNFTYLPLFAPLFAPFSWLDASVAACLWLLLKVALFATAIWWLARKNRVSHQYLFSAEACLLLAFGFNSAVMWDLTTGNTTFFQGFLLWFGFYALLKEREIIAGLAIAVSAFVKIQPILCLLLLILLPSRIRWRGVLSGALCFALFWVANIIFYPDLYAIFVQEALSRVSAENGALSPSLLTMSGDLAALTQSISYLPQILGSNVVLIRNTIYLLFASAIAIFAALRFWQARQRGAENMEILFFLFTAYFLIVPRVKSYDYALLLPVAIYIVSVVDLRFRYAILLLLCFPIISPSIDRAALITLDIATSPLLGPIKKAEFLFYHYLPYWSALVLFVCLSSRLLRQR